MPKRFQTPEIETPAADASERRMREILEGLRDVFVAVDAEWRITDCNARAEEILGRPRAELLGRTIWQVVGVPPDSPLGLAARRVRKTGEPEDAEFTLKLNGVERLLFIRGFPLDGGVAVVAADFTELRAAEQRLAESEAHFRELANHAPAATWSTGPDGALEYLNLAMLDVLGRSQPEVLGADLTRHMHPEDVAGFRQAMRRAQAAHARFVYDARMQRADGGWRTLHLAGVPRYDGAGAFRGHVGMAVDITEFLAARRRQEMLVKELNHRVRNTLATVQSIVRQTLKDTPASKAARDLLTDRLMALGAAHNVLSRENWQGAELSEMAREAVRAFDPEGRRIAIAGPKVRLYPGAALALFLAVNELATNAVRHGALAAPEGRIDLTWIRRDGFVDLEWRESGGLPVTPPTRQGFGSRLLGAGLEAELGAPAQITYAPEGLICRIRAPVTE